MFEIATANTKSEIEKIFSNLKSDLNENLKGTYFIN
jgi:hypothetical protein